MYIERSEKKTQLLSLAALLIFRKHTQINVVLTAFALPFSLIALLTFVAILFKMHLPYMFAALYAYISFVVINRLIHVYVYLYLYLYLY